MFLQVAKKMAPRQGSRCKWPYGNRWYDCCHLFIAINLFRE